MKHFVFVVFVFAISASGQTLNAPSSGNGILKGSSGSSTTTVAVPGVSYQSAITLSATDYLSGGTNGIVNAAAACAALSPVQCVVDIPGSYSGTDSIVGFVLDVTQPDVSSYSSNTIIIDHRYGKQTYVSNNCADSFSNQCTAYTKQWVYYQPQLTTSPNVFAFLDKYTVLAGGRNWHSSAGSSISNYQPDPKVGFFYTPGQSILGGVQLNKYSTGDSLLHSETTLTYGGVSGAATDEGNEWADITVSQGNVEFQAPVTVGGANTHVITIGAPSQGAKTLGEDRWVTDINATPYSTGSITSYSCGAPCVLNGTSTSWPTSTAIGTINSIITGPGPITITPSFTVGSASNFSTTALACISDSYESEFVFPTNVSGSNITISPTKPHLSTAIITTGGLCGYVFEFTADEVTSTTYSNLLNTLVPVGTLHRVWMVVSTPSATQMAVAIQAKGSYLSVAYNTSWNGSTKSGYKLFKAARVVAVSNTSGSNSGIGGGQIVLGDNGVTWSTSSVLNEFLGAEPLNSFGFHTQNQFFANLAGGGLGYTFSGLFQGADTALSLNNATPTSFYDLNGGGYFTPKGITLAGQYQSALSSTYGGRYADISMGCPSNGCVAANGNHPVLQISDALGSDSLEMQEVTGEWLLTTNNGVLTDAFRKDGLETTLEASASAASSSTVGKLYLNTGYQVCISDSTGKAHCARSAFPSTSVTLTPSSGVTSVSCVSSSCDLNGGSLQVVGGTFTTGSFVTVGYSSASLSVAPRTCSVSANGGATYLGLGHGTASVTSFTLTSAVSIAGATVNLDYSCSL